MSTYRKAGASWYVSGKGGSGTNGYKGDNLDALASHGVYTFAELRMGTALGRLPYKQPIEIRFNGKTIVAYKYDIGLGGLPVKGHPRAIDLYGPAATALGLDKAGLGVVEWRRLTPKEAQAASVSPVVGTSAPNSGGGTTVEASWIPGLPFFNPLDPLHPGLGPSGNPLDAITNPIGAAKDTLTLFKDVVSLFATISLDFLKLFQADTWFRIGKVIAGFLLAAIGIYYLITGTSPKEAANVAIKTGTKAAEVAAVA